MTQNKFTVVEDNNTLFVIFIWTADTVSWFNVSILASWDNSTAASHDKTPRPTELLVLLTTRRVNLIHHNVLLSVFK